MSYTKRPSTKLLGVFMLLALVSATFVPGAVHAQPSGGKTLRIHQRNYPALMDPQKSSFIDEIAVLSMTYEGLTRLDAKLNTVPAAAERWDFSPDGKTLTFHLRAGLTYSDGSPLTAERFRYAAERTCDPHTAGQYQAILFDIVGCQAFAGSLTPATPTAGDAQAAYAAAREGLGVEALDDRTLEIRLTHPAPYFPKVAGIWVFYPAKQELIEKGGEDWWKTPSNQLGNGPFQVDRMVQDQLITFAANPTYWAGRPKLDRLEYVIIKENAAALEAYKANKVDVLYVDPSQMPVVQGDPALGKELVTFRQAATFDLALNVATPPFNDKKVREAFAYAFDRKTWCEQILNNACLPTTTWIPEGVPGHVENPAMTFDPAKAQQALAASSYGSADKLPPITYAYVSDEPAERTRAEWIAGQYQDILGVTLKLQGSDFKTWVQLIQTQSTFPQITPLGWGQDYPDPQDWLSIYWTCKAQTYAFYAGYCNPPLDKLTQQADAELDPTKRTALYEQAGRLLDADVPAVITHNPAGLFLVKPTVTGYVPTPADAAWPGQWGSLLTIDVGR